TPIWKPSPLYAPRDSPNRSMGRRRRAALGPGRPGALALPFPGRRTPCFDRRRMRPRFAGACDPRAHPFGLGSQSLADGVRPEIERLRRVSLVSLFRKHALQPLDRPPAPLEAHAQCLVTLEQLLISGTRDHADPRPKLLSPQGERLRRRGSDARRQPAPDLAGELVRCQVREPADRRLRRPRTTSRLGEEPEPLFGETQGLVPHRGLRVALYTRALRAGPPRSRRRSAGRCGGGAPGGLAPRRDRRFP